MSADPSTWANRSPGDLDETLPALHAGNVKETIARSLHAAREWGAASLEERMAALRKCQSGIAANKELHARNISRETGKPLREARGEMDAVIAKFDLTFQDADTWIAEKSVKDGPHPAATRYYPYGVAAVVAPFNFPLHLGHGATVAYLLSGNTVIFKPSPQAAFTAEAYGADMQTGLPNGVFQILQGWGEVGMNLCTHEDVRAVCFTGSAAVGKILATELAGDFGKSLALELGGKNALVVCADANIAKAASAAADGFCLTAGQRCNATSRILVHKNRVEDFISALKTETRRYRPAFPLDEACTLGPLINEKAVLRYRNLIASPIGKWVIPGAVCETVDAHRGHYVEPAVVFCPDKKMALGSALYQEEAFAPVAMILPFEDEDDVRCLDETTPYGLTASIFTESRETFERIGRSLDVGNLYWNLPTTFSPSTLPFGGWGMSGNGRPGGRGFIRYTVREQAVQFNS